MNRATEFLAAFNDIERFLRNTVNAHDSLSFQALINQAEKRHILSSDHADALHAYASLRNAIVHGEFSDKLKPIADPRPDVVADIQRIARLLHNPRQPYILGNKQESHHI